MIKPNKKQTAWSALDTYIFQIVWIFLNRKV